MSKKSEIQIFLAHANEDKEEVSKLYDRLQQAGYKPWLDKKDLIPGQNWPLVIPDVIAKSQLFIACLSSRSIAKKGYVQKEFKQALNKYAEIAPDMIYIIPLRLDRCEIPNLRQNEYEINLRDLHWLDYWEESGFDQLERAIAYQWPFDIEVELESERGVDYTGLRNLLEAQRWKEADLETTRAMFQAAGNQNGTFLTREEVNEISCEDLRIINQLWLDSSNGRFGFSVQKEIYERLGGCCINYASYLDEQFWENFGDSIGWRKGGNWLDGSNLTYKKDALQGHLPSLTSQELEVNNKRGPWQVSSFAQRLVACDI